MTSYRSERFLSCFIGIPLPFHDQQKFEDVLSRIGLENIGLVTVKPETPHITIYYLGDQTLTALEQVVLEISQFLPLMVGTHMTVNQVGVFGGHDPRVLFFKVFYSPEIEKFYNSIQQPLRKFCVKKQMHFRPHLTLARAYRYRSRSALKLRLKSIEHKLSDISWHFPIDHISIYGIGPGVRSTVHQELFRLEIPKNNISQAGE
ncbi:MAG: RNA 2',3'-cyclic phosphodiesterase [Patescibacteria group bacterium]|jgi:2'-5' RNA ligase